MTVNDVIDGLKHRKADALKEAKKTFNPVEISHWKSMASAYQSGIWAVEKVIEIMESEGDRNDQL